MADKSVFISSCSRRQLARRRPAGLLRRTASVSGVRLRAGASLGRLLVVAFVAAVALAAVLTLLLDV